MFSNVRYYSEYFVSGIAYFAARIFRQTMNSSLTPIEPITQLSPLVCRILGANASPLTLQGTNTYLVGSGKSRILIDTGEANVSKYLVDLRAALKGDDISCIICTHWHDDHVGGVEAIIKKIIGHSVPVYKMHDVRVNEDSQKYEYVKHNQVIKAEDATLRVLATPGHTMDHICLYLEEENSLFSGDCILGEGTCIFEDLYTYMKSLSLLLDLKPQRIYPGHGPVVEDAVERISSYIIHRNSREQEILEYMQSSGTVTSFDIVRVIYKKIPLAVKIAASNNVVHHLVKLIKEGKVEEVSSGLYRLIPS
ncbi:hypothetical protein AB6A40_003890 [Gnathostoma spinigerum]|uniref:Beta-lactamase-like protein 2 homolog n=1 Tax=Gnathostoma spinigerum TaxID=75299 RepID=A0ABD6EC04_9BILA